MGINDSDDLHIHGMATLLYLWQPVTMVALVEISELTGAISLLLDVVGLSKNTRDFRVCSKLCGIDGPCTKNLRPTLELWVEPSQCWSSSPQISSLNGFTKSEISYRWQKYTSITLTSLEAYLMPTGYNSMTKAIAYMRFQPSSTATRRVPCDRSSISYDLG